MKLDVEKVSGFFHEKAFRARRAWMDFSLKHGLAKIEVGTFDTVTGKHRILNKAEIQEMSDKAAKHRAEREARKNAPTL